MDAPVVAVAPISTPVVTEPTTISPTKAAATKGDFLAFDDAERAARSGKPLPDVAAPPVTAKKPAASAAPVAAVETVVEPAETRRTREEKDQQRINDAIQRGIAAELDRRAAAAPPVAAEKPVAVPDYKRIMALPGAPKLAEFDSAEEHNFAAATFVQQTLSAERTAETQHASTLEQLTQEQTARVDRFVTQLNETKAADPTFVEKLSADVKALKPFGALTPGEVGGPANVVAEQLYDSPVAPAVALELSKPGVLAALLAMPPHIAAMTDPARRTSLHTQHLVREFNRLEGRLLASTASSDAPAPVETTAKGPIATVPAPVATIQRARTVSDPTKAAIAKNDFGAFDRIEREKELAKRRDRAGV